MLNEDSDEEDSALYKRKTQPKLTGSARGSFQSRSMYMSYYCYCLDISYLCRCFVTTPYSHSDLSNDSCRHWRQLLEYWVSPELHSDYNRLCHYGLLCKKVKSFWSHKSP